MRDTDELTLREQELLHEMEIEQENHLSPQEDTDIHLPETEDDGDACLWDDEDAPTVSNKPKVSWPEIKQQLNDWGNIFSSGDVSQRVTAIERIFNLFDQVTESSKDFDPDSKALEKWYDRAMGFMRIRFIGETAPPIRYLKHYYPEDVFFNALCHTLGFSASAENEAVNSASGAYNAAKGAQYVTYFTNVLDNFSKRRRSELTEDFRGTNQVFAENTLYAEALQEESATESLMFRAEANRRQAAALVDLAMLTADKLQLDKVLPIGDNAENKPKGVKAATLQLFYSFQLVNFTRFATQPVSHRDDRILISTADSGFLTFSTAVGELTYWALVQAELSNYILENNLYVEKDSKKLLLQRAVARYRNVSESTFSPQFDAAARYFRRHWQYKNNL